VNCNKLPKFKHVSQQRADIFNIFYESEYHIN
jgi:hypothetical protein